MAYCKANLSPSGEDARSFGHWHYSHYYYAQVMYRLGGEEWKSYNRTISQNILRKQSADGSWKEGHVGPVYTTAMNTTILQLDNGYSAHLPALGRSHGIDAITNASPALPCGTVTDSARAWML